MGGFLGTEEAAQSKYLIAREVHVHMSRRSAQRLPD